MPGKTGGLYYKPMMIINEDSRVINKLKASITDNARVVIYDCHMFIVQATGTHALKSSLYIYYFRHTFVCVGDKVKSIPKKFFLLYLLLSLGSFDKK